MQGQALEGFVKALRVLLQSAQFNAQVAQQFPFALAFGLQLGILPGLQLSLQLGAQGFAGLCPAV